MNIDNNSLNLISKIILFIIFRVKLNTVMNELGFIKYLIKLSNKYDSNIHKYFPNQELRNHYNKKLCKK